MRKDVPGGFPSDTINVFNKDGRTALQNEAIDFLSKVANWRKGNKVISEGKLTHFMPENGMYVYERRLGERRAIVIMNGTDKELTIDMSIYAEIIPAGTTLKDVITDKTLTIEPSMKFAPRALYILE